MNQVNSKKDNTKTYPLKAYGFHKNKNIGWLIILTNMRISIAAQVKV